MPIDHVNRVMTTDSFSKPQWKCSLCGAKVAYFAIGPNGGLICAECAGPNALIDLIEPADAPEARPDEE